MSTAPPRSMKALAAQQGSFEAILPGVSQALAFTGTSAQSTALGTSTTLVKIFATTDCFIKVATDPTAVADGTCMFVPAGIIDFIGVGPGQKIAAIRNASSGTLYITEAT